jgi:hypothetical protein
MDFKEDTHIRSEQMPEAYVEAFAALQGMPEWQNVHLEQDEYGARRIVAEKRDDTAKSFRLVIDPYHRHLGLDIRIGFDAAPKERRTRDAARDTLRRIAHTPPFQDYDYRTIGVDIRYVD